MTISAYNVDRVISAYNKQSKVRVRQSLSADDTKNSKYYDVVALSHEGTDKSEAYNKISYSIIDIIGYFSFQVGNPTLV